ADKQERSHDLWRPTGKWANRGNSGACRRELYSPARRVKVAATLMPFEITISRDFSAAHQLRLLDGTLEPLHSHNWGVRVTVAADNLDAVGTAMDFHKLERLVDDLIGPMRDRNLDDMQPFSTAN